MRQYRRSGLGFTLIELMITVAIVAILARIGYASYMKSVISANRSDATIALTNWSQILERCYTQNFYYYNASPTTSSPDCTSPPSSGTTTLSPNKYYSITASRTTNTYTLTATPMAGTLQTRDSSCPTFTLDNTGARGPTSTASTCWGTN